MVLVGRKLRSSAHVTLPKFVCLSWQAESPLARNPKLTFDEDVDTLLTHSNTAKVLGPTPSRANRLLTCARKDGRRKEARPDREEAHEALQPPPVGPLYACRPIMEKAKGNRQPCPQTLQGPGRYAKGALENERWGLRDLQSGFGTLKRRIWTLGPAEKGGKSRENKANRRRENRSATVATSRPAT